MERVVPGLRGVLDASTTLKSVDKDEYACAWCAAGYTPILDEIVEVTFTVSRRVRRIAAHDPDELPFNEYFRQVFWGSGIDVPDNFEELIEEITLETSRAAARRKGALSLQLPAEFVILLDPVTHGDAVHRRQGRADARAPEPVARLRPAARADRHRRAASGAAAPVARKPHRHAGVAGGVDRR